MPDAEVDGGVFDLDRIRLLVELMKEHGLTEIDLREAEQQIRLCLGSTHASVAPVPALAPAPMQPSAAEDPSDNTPEHIVLIKSPMVGTYYSKPNPNSDPYTRVGDHVDPTTTVCIIEAMKVFNEIPAEVTGKIVAVLVEDEEPVDVGKPLFKVDTSQ
ncbi:MAG: acetyl-CoA carboxylase, biotin carboxyl carrier protein [Planctomycetaceae bacterium]|jgi:acetyl-CoA carboxylase biotin carboxyl carrier protein|nr:acetyl-CoA carboxylase, biotin carboxyl carrier protein [Planctomycetaceae bacterium]HAA70239.1 acetyl-CoA carboxylase biotin carboxyl carrier protein [Planctomycetaceae bacterium]|tara:strand:- start:356 stop:829 length:474 start_codon:yes stop_codon:yes gene_type:complete